MMAGIRSKDTKPELLIRRGLHGRGFRFRLHDRRLPGTPDLVFPRYRSVVFVHGCFWHRHECSLFKWPSSRQEFWTAKISGNRNADERNASKLMNEGWRVLVVWECSLRGRGRSSPEAVLDAIAGWLLAGPTGDERGLTEIGEVLAVPQADE